MLPSNILNIFRGYDMILFDKKIVFAHAPRTSGTSIEHALLEGRLVKDSMKHLRASQLKKLVGKEWGQYYKFTIVRNPWDRIVSMYHQPYFAEIGALTNKDLDFFIANYKPAPWEHGVQCSDYADEEMNLVLRFESRTEGLDKFEKETGIKINNNIHKRSTNRTESSYRDFYTETTKKAVEQMFRDDIERYGYKF